MIGNLNIGVAKVVSATGNIKSSQGGLLGIFVSAASATPTITVYNSATTTTTDPLFTVFTPVAGTWYPMPVAFADGLYIVISGTVSATVSYV
jgi:hypothetical protein